MVSGEVFARFADIVRKEWGVRSHVNSNEQTITVWDEHGTPYTMSIEQKKFRGPQSPRTHGRLTW